MKNSIVISGIYDKRTIKGLSEIGVSKFGFDFRPTSFNFLQHYQLVKFIRESPMLFKDVRLHFCNEADFVVKKFIEDLKEVDQVDFSLEFSDFINKEYYEQFEKSFYWHLQFEKSYSEILSCKNIKGVILNIEDLIDLKNKNQLINFFNNYHQVLNKLQKNDLLLGLQIDWDSPLPALIMDLFDFDFVNININSKVEVCYRNVDLNRLKGNVTSLHKIEL